MSRLSEMFFSQNSLEIFSKCRMKFKKRYVDGLWWHSEGENRAEKGRLFHLIASRYFAGIIDDSIVDENSEYRDIEVWMERLKKFIPKTEDGSKNYYPEYELRLSDKGIKIQAKYDLIIIDDKNKAVIYDWKVQEKPIKDKPAANAFQTRIYRYLMAKVGDIITGKAINPEDITMIYWQPKHPTIPVVIEYSNELFRQDEEFINGEIRKIMNCNFDSDKLKTIDEKICRFCEFSNLCNGFDAQEVNDEEAGVEFEWEDIEEVEF